MAGSNKIEGKGRGAHKAFASSFSKPTDLSRCINTVQVDNHIPFELVDLRTHCANRKHLLIQVLQHKKNGAIITMQFKISMPLNTGFK